MIEKSKKKISIPKGITLLEVLISLLVISIISLISLRVVSKMGQAYEKIKLEENNQRGISNSFRLLEEDFNSLNYYKKKYFIEKFIFKKNKLTLPNGVVWQLSNGTLGRFKNMSTFGSKEILLLKNISAFKLRFWVDNKFIDYQQKNNFFLQANKNIGVEVRITQKNNKTIRKVIILKGLM